MKIVIGLLVAVLLVLVAVDIVSTPAPDPSVCVLDNDLVLPDSCTGSCDRLLGCPPASTRPYLIFFEEAASCPDACVRLD